jgi:tRNA(fMet)-specific endonuclease VapC
MAIILDADVIIAGERGTFDLEQWLNSRRTQPFEIAAITIAELWHGVERAIGIQRARREEYLKEFVSGLSIIPYSDQTAYEHARLWARMEASGSVIGAHDLIVAATALERGSPVATFNVKHFAQVEGLMVIDPRLHQ